MSGFGLLMSWRKVDIRYLNEFKKDFWLHENAKWLKFRMKDRVSEFIWKISIYFSTCARCKLRGLSQKFHYTPCFALITTRQSLHHLCSPSTISKG